MDPKRAPGVKEIADAAAKNENAGGALKEATSSFTSAAMNFKTAINDMDGAVTRFRQGAGDVKKAGDGALQMQKLNRSAGGRQGGFGSLATSGGFGFATSGGFGFAKSGGFGVIAEADRNKIGSLGGGAIPGAELGTAVAKLGGALPATMADWERRNKANQRANMTEDGPTNEVAIAKKEAAALDRQRKIFGGKAPAGMSAETAKMMGAKVDEQKAEATIQVQAEVMVKFNSRIFQNEVVKILRENITDGEVTRALSKQFVRGKSTQV
jgi:hypothetical protein